MESVDHKKAIEILEGKRLVTENHHITQAAPSTQSELKDLCVEVNSSTILVESKLDLLNTRLTGMGKFIAEGNQRLEALMAERTPVAPRIYARQPNMSEQIGEITKALAAARKEIGSVQKGGNSNRGTFMSQLDMSAACEPILEAHGLTATFLIDYNEYNELVIVLVLSHSSGQWFRSAAPLREELALTTKDDYHKRVGSAEKYLRRYMYRAMLCLAEEGA